MDLGAQWERHAERPEAVLDYVMCHLSEARDPGAWFGAAVLGSHVAGAHLGEWQRGIDFLHHVCTLDAFDARLPQGRGVFRLLAMLHTCAGDQVAAGEALERAHNPGDPADCAPIRMLAGVAEALVDQHQSERAQQAFEKALSLAAYGPEGSDPAARGLAVAGNNIACSLEARDERTPQEVALMKEAAAVARLYWEVAGDWTHVKIAEYRLAMTYLAAGEPFVAIEHAERALELVTENEGSEQDRFFPRLALAQAELGRGDADAARAVLQLAGTAVVEWGREEFDALVAKVAEG